MKHRRPEQGRWEWRPQPHLTCLTYLTCLTGLTYLTCLIAITGLTYLSCLTNILPWIDEAQKAGARSVGLKTSTSQIERTASTPVMATETYLPTRCSAHSRVSVSPSGNSLGIQSHRGFSLWVVELPTLTSAWKNKEIRLGLFNLG